MPADVLGMLAQLQGQGQQLLAQQQAQPQPNADLLGTLAALQALTQPGPSRGTGGDVIRALTSTLGGIAQGPMLAQEIQNKRAAGIADIIGTLGRLGYGKAQIELELKKLGMQPGDDPLLAAAMADMFDPKTGKPRSGYKLTLGPPERRITIGGEKPREAPNAQIKEYIVNDPKITGDTSGKAYRVRDVLDPKSGAVRSRTIIGQVPGTGNPLIDALMAGLGGGTPAGQETPPVETPVTKPPPRAEAPVGSLGVKPPPKQNEPIDKAAIWIGLSRKALADGTPPADIVSELRKLAAMSKENAKAAEQVGHAIPELGYGP